MTSKKNNMQEREKTMVDRVEIWDIARLIPSARNARTHSDGQVAEIAGSIRTFGFIVPVLVDGNGSILAGHGRVLAARQLKLERIPVLVVDHLSDAERRAYSIADNKIALNAGWNEELLKIELETLASEGIEPSSLGFSDEEFNALIDQLRPEPNPNDDVVPRAPVKAVSEAGDIWQLGDHRLLCGDPLEAANYVGLLEGRSAAMVFTEPREGDTERSTEADEDGWKGLFLEAVCQHLLANTEGALYLYTSPAELHTLQTAFRQAGGHCSAIVICGKPTFSPGQADYQRQFDPMLYGWREGQSHYWSGVRDQGDLWMMEGLQTSNLHTVPVELVERAVKNSSRRGDIVMDPFAGTGSTVIACEKTGRAARVMEQDPKRCDVIISRWQDFTGKEAIHIGSGQTLAERSAIHSSQS